MRIIEFHKTILYKCHRLIHTSNPDGTVIGHHHHFDHQFHQFVNIFLLIAGTYTPVSFALEPFWRNVIIISMWACTAIAIVIHVIWINAPRWLYTVVYIIFGIYGLAYMVMFWNSPYAGPAVVVLLCAGGACYILGAIVYALRKPDPWPRVFGFHEIFHCGTVAGYACHMVAIYMVIVSLWQ